MDFCSSPVRFCISGCCFAFGSFAVVLISFDRTSPGVQWAKTGPALILGGMFDEWKNAWQQAVENLERELEAPDERFSPNQRATAMRRDLAAARNALKRLAADLEQARKDLAGEEESEQTARRRSEMAERI